MPFNKRTRSDHRSKPKAAAAAAPALTVVGVVVTGVGVRVTFKEPYVSHIEEDLKPSAVETFNRIANATGSCQVHRCNTSAIELMSQQDNPRVNTLEAMRRTVAGAQPEPRAGSSRPRGRQLKVQRWTLWCGRLDQATQVFSANVPEDQVLTVMIHLEIAGGFSDRDLKKLERAVANFPGAQLVTTEPAFEAVVQYVTAHRSDVTLPSEVVSMADRLGKAF